MPRNYWAYEPRSSYRARQSREANTVMNREMTREMLRAAVSSRGIDPDMFPQLANFDFVNQTPRLTGLGTGARGQMANRLRRGEKIEEPGDGGFLGDIVRTGVKAAKGINKYSTAIYRAPGIRDVVEPALGGKIEQPWDLLRPIKRALDWETRHIGEPIYGNTIRGMATPIIAASEGVSLGEANRRADYRYEHEFPEWLKEVGGGTTSPSSLIEFAPVSALAKAGLRGSRLARIPMLDRMYSAAGSRRAIASSLGIAGAAEDTPQMRKLIEDTADLGRRVKLPTSVTPRRSNELGGVYDFGDLTLDIGREQADVPITGINIRGKGQSLRDLLSIRNFVDEYRELNPGETLAASMDNEKLKEVLLRQGWEETAGGAGIILKPLEELRARPIMVDRPRYGSIFGRVSPITDDPEKAMWMTPDGQMVGSGNDYDHPDMVYRALDDDTIRNYQRRGDPSDTSDGRLLSNFINETGTIRVVNTKRLLGEGADGAMALEHPPRITPEQLRSMESLAASGRRLELAPAGYIGGDEVTDVRGIEELRKYFQDKMAPSSIVTTGEEVPPGAITMSAGGLSEATNAADLKNIEEAKKLKWDSLGGRAKYAVLGVGQDLEGDDLLQLHVRRYDNEKQIMLDIYGKGRGLRNLLKIRNVVNGLRAQYPDYEFASTVVNPKLADMLELKGWTRERLPFGSQAGPGLGEDFSLMTMPPDVRMAGELSEATNDLGQARLPTTLSDSVVTNAPPLKGRVSMGGERPPTPEELAFGVQDTAESTGMKTVEELSQTPIELRRKPLSEMSGKELSEELNEVLNRYPETQGRLGAANKAEADSLVEYQKAIYDEMDYREGSYTPPSKRGIAGGAPEGKSMAQIIRDTNRLPADAWAARSPDEIYQEAKANSTLTSDLRKGLGGLLPEKVTRWIQERGLRLTDNAMSAQIDEWNRLRSQGRNTAVFVAREQIRTTLDEGFKIDWETGRVLDLPGKPHIEDVADNVGKYNLTELQKRVLDLAEQPLKDIAELRASYGIKVAPSKNRFHLQTAKKPVQRLNRRGETVEELEGIPVATKSGLRAKQSFKYPRQFATRAEGEAAGHEYLPFLEAQQARIEQEYNTIADEWLMTALEGHFGATPMDELTRLKPELLKLHEATGTRLANLRSLKQSITSYKKAGYAKYGWSDPFSKKAAGALDETVRPFYDEVVAASRIAKKPEREAAFNEILNRVSMETGRTGAHRQALSQERLKELELLRGGTAERPVSIRGRLYKEEEGTILQDVMYGERTPGSIEGSVIQLNDALRPMMATLDASFMGVQGLIGLFTNPKAYAQALHHAFSGPAYDARIMELKKRGVIDSFINHTGHWASRNDPGEFLFQGRVAKLPGVRHANTWFTRFGNSLRIHLYDSMMNWNQTDAQLNELAKVAGLATGYAPGKVTNVERAALFAPRFFRSQLGLLSTALGGNLSRQGQREAMKSVAGLIGGGAVLTYAINEALGQETDMDPNSPNFMRIRALDKDISVFGPWDTFARAMIKEAGDVANGQTIPGTGEGAKYLASAKASPGVSLFKAAWDGETRAGGDVEIDWTSPETIAQSGAMAATNLLATVAPISAQATFEEGIPSTPEEFAGAGLSFVGTKANPLSGSEKRQIARDEAAVNAYGIPWDSLEPYQKNEVLQANPNLEPGKAETETARAWESFRAIGEESNNLQLQLDQSVAIGPEWIEQYKALRERIAGRYLEWEQTHPELVEQMQSREIKDPNEQARIDYINAFKESRTAWGGLDVDKLSARLDELESTWNTEQQAYVDRNTGFKATDQVKAYRAANRVLAPYWDVEDEVWQFVVQNRPELATFATMDDYLLAKSDELRQMGMPDEAIGSQLQKLPLIAAIQKEVSNRRLRVRFENPEVDKMLSLWYGATPLAMQERFQPKTTASTRRRSRSRR